MSVLATYLAMAFGLGTSFGKLGAIRRKAAAGGGGNPIPGTPTYYIYGF